MQKIRETDPRFIFLRSKIALFIGVALAGCVILLFFIGKHRGYFVKTEDFYFITPKATGLYKGMAVKISGFKIGRLKDIILQDDGSVKVTLSIEAARTKWIREDSVAVFGKEGLIGESSIEIIPGTGKALKPGGVIKFEKQKGIEEMAGELKTEIEDILKGIKQTVNYINEPHGSLRKTLSNAEKVSENLIETTALMNKILNEINSKAPSITEKSEATVEQLNELIKETRKNLNSLSADLKEISQAIKTTTNKDLPVMVEQTKKTLEDMDEILRSLKGMWPIRTGIKEPEIKPIEADSYEK